MKTAKARDEMVARVKQAAAKHPTFESWPVATKVGQVTVRMRPPFDQAAYVAALYEICAIAKPTGRSAEGGALTGDRIAE